MKDAITYEDILASKRVMEENDMVPAEIHLIARDYALLREERGLPPRTRPKPGHRETIAGLKIVVYPYEP